MIRPDHRDAPREAGSRLATASLVIGITNALIASVFYLGSIIDSLGNQASIQAYYMNMYNNAPLLLMALSLSSGCCLLLSPVAALGGMLMGIMSLPAQGRRVVPSLGIAINLIMLVISVCPVVIAITDVVMGIVP